MKSVLSLHGLIQGAAGPILALLLVFTAHAGGTSPRDLIASGNRSYGEARFSQALEFYDRALELMPDSPEVLLNKGNAHFQNGEFDKARDAYGRAVMLCRRSPLRAKAEFNLGCAANREALQNDKSEQEAMELIGLAIRHYKEAVKLDPGYRPEAGRGIESARLAVFRIQEKIRPDATSNNNRDVTIKDDSSDESQRDKTRDEPAGNSPGQLLPENTNRQGSAAKYRQRMPGDPRETPADILREEAEDQSKFQRASRSGDAAVKDW